MAESRQSDICNRIFNRYGNFPRMIFGHRKIIGIFFKVVVGGGGVSKWAYFCIQPSFIFYLMCRPICLLYRVIQDFVRKALFSEIQAVGSE